MPKDPHDNLSHQTFATRSTTEPKVTRAFAVEAARLARDNKCEDVVLLDVKGISQVTDYLVIASGTSGRQMKSTADDIDDLGQEQGCPTFRRNQDEDTTWIVIDCVDVVVHLFEPHARAHYDLEMLWADAPRLEWRRDDQAERDRAGLGTPDLDADDDE